MTNHKHNTSIAMFLAFAFIAMSKGRVDMTAAQFAAAMMELTLFMSCAIWIVKEFDNFKN